MAELIVMVAAPAGMSVAWVVPVYVAALTARTVVPAANGCVSAHALSWNVMSEFAATGVAVPRTFWLSRTVLLNPFTLSSLTVVPEAMPVPVTFSPAMTEIGLAMVRMSPESMGVPYVL